jgi:hypothetical protein
LGLALLSAKLHTVSMATKRPRDPIQLAHQVFLESIGEAPKTEAPKPKDPAAVALGRRGGIARAAALPAKKRVQIAAKGAKARWGASGPKRQS